MVNGKDFDNEFEVIRVRKTGSKNSTNAVDSKVEEKMSVENTRQDMHRWTNQKIIFIQEV